MGLRPDLKFKLNQLFNSSTSVISMGVNLGDLLDQMIEESVDDYIENNVDVNNAINTILQSNLFEYNPSNPADWDTVPDDVKEALDTLASLFADMSYTPANPSDWPTIPSNIPAALDILADELADSQGITVGSASLPVSASTFTISFPNIGTSSYVLVLSISNLVESTIRHLVPTITAKTASSFTFKTSQTTDHATYKVEFFIKKL